VVVPLNMNVPSEVFFDSFVDELNKIAMVPAGIGAGAVGVAPPIQIKPPPKLKPPGAPAIVSQAPASSASPEGASLPGGA